MSIFQVLVACQALYIGLTAIWPLVHMRSFLAVTGPKTDLWLVKTVAALLIPIALTLGVHSLQTMQLTSLILGSGTAIAFICIDTFYVAKGTISRIYLLDAALEILFVGGWIYLVFKTPAILHGQ